VATEPDYSALLRGVPLFADVPDRSLEGVTAMASDVTHDEGHVVVRQGVGRAHALHVIVEGKASVSADGKRIATLGPGDYFGEIAVVDRTERTATVTAVSQLRVIAIDATSFRRLVRSDPALAATLPDAIAERLQDLDDKLSD
jgi:CRP-like cAMP-binding protein